EAIGLYEACLEEGKADASLAADVRHNLELARLLLRQAKQDDANNNAASEDQGAQAPQPEDKRPDTGFGSDDPGSAASDLIGRPERLSDAARDPNAAAKANQQPSPGKGELPPLPDEDEL